jgi:hypothetical protein
MGKNKKVVIVGAKETANMAYEYFTWELNNYYFGGIS